MKIWIDICHTPQYNFYRNLILRLVSEGHEVFITVLRRGKTPVIVRRELAEVLGKSEEVRGKSEEGRGKNGQVHIYEIGRHRMTKWSALLEANVLRLISLFFWRLMHRVDVAFGNGMQPAIIQALFRGRSYSFDDDPQTMDFAPKARFNTECNFCLYEDAATAAHGGKVQVLRCLKEWAYLAPNVFSPNPKALEKYGVRPKEYIFLREVSVGTVNYAGQAPQAILTVKDLINSLCQSSSAGANAASSYSGVNTVPSHTGANTAFYADSGESLQFCATGGEQFCNLDGKAPSGDVALTEKADVELAQKTDLADNAKASIGDAASGQIFSSKPCASANLPAAHTFKVLFSLEEKHRRNEYPEDWILLQEPIEGIHSLMYYSAGLVSSGDSMAREAALLGIPAYYLGTRHSMPANLAAAKVAGLQNELTMPFSDWLNTLHGTPDELQQKQDTLRRKIDADFIDINAYMLSLVENS